MATRNTDILGKRRGRPPGLLTDRRKQMLGAIIDGAAEGRPISFIRLAKQCGLCDYREARRIVKDLKRLGHAMPDESLWRGPGRPRKVAN